MTGLLVLASVAVAGIATTLTSTPADAVGGGFDPRTTPVVEPVSGQQVAEWRLAGRSNASGVQIAPDWIISSGHAAARVGGTFQNEYGTSTVDSVVTCGGFQSGCDVSLAHLATALPAPSFPDLLVDGFPANPQPLGGNVLAAGYGGSRFAVGWVRPTGQTAYDTMFAPPSSIGGDSGGPTFYFRPGSTQGHLLGLMVSADAGVTGGLQTLTSAKVRPFLDKFLPAGTVRWAAFDDLGPRPVLPTAVRTPTATSTATSVKLSWTAPAAGSAAIIDYRAVLIRKDNQAERHVVVTSATNALFDKVQPNVGYWAFVLPRSTAGEAPVPWSSRMGTATPTYTFTTVVAAGPAPGQVTNVRAATRKGALEVSWIRAAGAVAGVNSTEIVVHSCTPAGGCQTMGAPIITSGSTALVTLPTGFAVYGQRFTMLARDSNLTGTSTWSVGFGYYLPLAPPLRVLDARVEQKADGELAFSFHTQADDPALSTRPMKLYRPHAEPDYHQVSVVDPATGSEQVVSYAFALSRQPLTMPWTDLGLPAGRYQFRFTAITSEWGASTVAVNAEIGGVAAATQIVRVPAPPQTPVNLVGAAQLLDGGTGVLSWTLPARQPGQAAPNAFMVIVHATNAPTSTPRVYETAGSNRSISYQLPAGTYTVSVYAVNQLAGPSEPATS